MTIGGGAWSSQKRGFDAQVQEKSGMGINAAAIYNHAQAVVFSQHKPLRTAGWAKIFHSMSLGVPGNETKTSRYRIEFVDKIRMSCRLIRFDGDINQFEFQFVVIVLSSIAAIAAIAIAIMKDVSQLGRLHRAHLSG